jgi:hypothetical protein
VVVLAVLALISQVRPHSCHSPPPSQAISGGLERQTPSAQPPISRARKPFRETANGLTERRRSRTDRAWGYHTAQVLKTCWATGPMPLREGGYRAGDPDCSAVRTATGRRSLECVTRPCHRPPSRLVDRETVGSTQRNRGTTDATAPTRRSSQARSRNRPCARRRPGRRHRRERGAGRQPAERRNVPAGRLAHAEDEQWPIVQWAYRLRDLRAQRRRVRRRRSASVRRQRVGRRAPGAHAVTTTVGGLARCQASDVHDGVPDRT